MTIKHYKSHAREIEIILGDPELPQICTVILFILIGKVAWVAVYNCGNFWVTQYDKDLLAELANIEENHL